MAKDYFDDDVTPLPKQVPVRVRTSVPIQEQDEHDDVDVGIESSSQTPEKSIRNIKTSGVRVRPRPSASPDIIEEDDSTPSHRGRYVLWGVVCICVFFAGVFVAIALRPTTITITPRSHVITFDQSIKFTAYPATTAPTGALAYTLQTFDLEDSDVIPTSGIQHVEEKASGSITVYNTFSNDTVRLIKNTRFATPDGLIFRVPADVAIPGKKGNTPGKVSVTVFADAVGEKYNVAPAAHWTLPGLKSNKVMYAGVYASSDTSMSGGFSGDRAGFAPGALEAAIATIRGRLADKARAALLSAEASSSTALPGLLSVVYESLPQTQEAGGGARIHERAHVEIPIFSIDAFAHTVADSVSTDSTPGSVAIMFRKDFSAQVSDAVHPIADQAFQFSMTGSADLVWHVDTQALLQALSDREEGAFKTVVDGFPAIQEAKARIEPFWNSRFPHDPSSIKVDVLSPVQSGS